MVPKEPIIKCSRCIHRSFFNRGHFVLTLMQNRTEKKETSISTPSIHQTNKQTNKQTSKQASKLTNKPTNQPTNQQTKPNSNFFSSSS